MAFKRKALKTGKRTMRKKSFARKSTTKMSFAKRVKKVLLKVAEPKNKYTAMGKQEMYHNVTDYKVINNSGWMPTQGVGDNQRIGDMVNISGFRLRIMYGSKQDRPNVNWRWWVVKIPKGSAATYVNCFNAYTNNVMIDDINTDFCKVLKKGSFSSKWAGQDATVGKESTSFKTISVPYKKLYKFGPGNGAVTHNDDDVALITAAYDAYGTLLTDNIGYFESMLDIYYRDP
jgi:hypothetical protein